MEDSTTSPDNSVTVTFPGVDGNALVVTQTSEPEWSAFVTFNGVAMGRVTEVEFRSAPKEEEEIDRWDLWI